LLEDPSAPPRANDPEEHSEALFRAHTLKRVARLLAEAGVQALLVKGAALALTVYPDPAARRMLDIDLLVREGERDRVVAALVAGGCEERPEPGRPHSADLLGETVLLVRAGAMAGLVEVHTTLSKIVTRPIDMREVFARATPAPALPGLLVPAAEDHALFIALHAAGHDFAHPVAFLDLEMLLRRGLDEELLARRAKEWRLSSVMFAALSAMRQLGAASVTDGLVARFDPGPLRRALVRNAAARGAARPGLRSIAAQPLLRDDTLAWVAGIGRYAAARARDRMASGGQDRQDPAVPYRTPLWARALLVADRAMLRVGNALGSVRDEAFLAWVPPEERTALTASLYAEMPSYFPGGKRFEMGLFPWEARIVSSPPFPQSGRILLGGAGAGRELAALVERGFDVVAFDPCRPFADAARAVGRGGARSVEVIHASYEDLVRAASGRGGPLAPACTGRTFDAVVLGWGSFSHVLPARARLELLRALRVVCPDGPVLASFGLVTDPVGHAMNKNRVGKALRRVFAAVGAPGTSEDRDHFLSGAGFVAFLERGEVRGLARDAGYEIAVFEEGAHPHALFVPAKPGS
jgi:SAM-dependent methyltransferase